MTCWIKDAPRPPYSLGQWIHIQPPPASCRCQARRRSNSSCVSGSCSSPSSRQSRGRCFSSQLRNSWRNASSSALNLKSIAACLSSLVELANRGSAEVSLCLAGSLCQRNRHRQLNKLLSSLFFRGAATMRRSRRLAMTRLLTYQTYLRYLATHEPAAADATPRTSPARDRNLAENPWLCPDYT